MSTCTSCRASAPTPERISHDTFCPGAVFAHWVVSVPVTCTHDDFSWEGVDGDGADIYSCDDCGETWNTGESEDDYALACDAQHAANPHRFEGEL